MTQFRFRSFLAIGLIAGSVLSGPVAAAQSPQPVPRYVKAEAVNVRGGPGISNGVVTVLQLGSEVSVYVSRGDWARISPPGQPEKWIYAPLLQDTRPPAVKASHKPVAKPDRKDQPAPSTPSPKASKQPDPHGERKDPSSAR